MPGVAQMVGRGIAVLFHDRVTGSRWAVSSTLRQLFTSEKDSVPILQALDQSPQKWTDWRLKLRNM